jgi:hypothetical protein
MAHTLEGSGLSARYRISILPLLSLLTRTLHLDHESHNMELEHLALRLDHDHKGQN